MNNHAFIKVTTFVRPERDNIFLISAKTRWYFLTSAWCIRKTCTCRITLFASISHVHYLVLLTAEPANVAQYSIALRKNKAFTLEDRHLTIWESCGGTKICEWKRYESREKWFIAIVRPNLPCGTKAIKWSPEIAHVYSNYSLGMLQTQHGLNQETMCL